MYDTTDIVECDQFNGDARTIQYAHGMAKTVRVRVRVRAADAKQRQTKLTRIRKGLSYASRPGQFSRNPVMDKDLMLGHGGACSPKPPTWQLLEEV
eukprot:6185175-Pleurochrysis_carterae.AAC.6